MKKKNRVFFQTIIVALSIPAAMAFATVLFMWKLESAAENDIAYAISVFRKSVYLIMVVPSVLILIMVTLLVWQRRNRLKLQNLRKALSALYDTLPGGVLRCKNDDRWTVLFANTGFFRFLGCTKQEFSEIYHDQAISIIHPDDYRKISANRSFLLTFGSVLADEYRVICADGTIKWVWLNTELVEDATGEKSFYCTFTDITPMKETQEQMMVNQRLYEIVLDQTQDTVFEWNILENTAYFSKNFYKKFGYEPSTSNFPECIEQHDNIFKGDLESFRKIGRQLINGEKFATGEFRVKKADSSFLWCSVSATAILDQDGKAYKAVGILSDIDAQRQVLQTAKEYAQKDSLTGLYNKGATESRIRAYIEQKKAPAALFIIDIDNFKRVNDTLGHLYGDAALKEIAYAVKSLFRSSDVIGRIGGDEFVVFLEQISDENTVYKKAGNITEIFRHAFAQTNVNYQMTGSIGVAFYPKDADNYPELFDKADIALYFAKNHGKNQFAAYCEKVEEENVLRCGIGSKKY
ncbi:MAG: sensor domain-containing diguanylate cyclase [Ruminococcaceae bacterium]|jgi:diguanylate cyclase (GGDEF)-like protein/PAS domain S-box-containing protein|nr:sensor domain-containing diguanylate cyclase [Oscillospiraceae bacterium]